MQHNQKIKPYSNLNPPSIGDQFHQSAGDEKHLPAPKPHIIHQKTEDINDKNPYEPYQKHNPDSKDKYQNIPSENDFSNPNTNEQNPNNNPQDYSIPKEIDLEKKPYSKVQKEIKYAPANLDIQGKGLGMQKGNI